MKMKRSNFDVVMRALSEYVPVTLGGRVYRLIKAGDPIVAVSGVFESDHDVLCHVLQMFKNESKAYAEITLPADLTVNNLIELADSLTEEDIINCIFSHAGRI